MAARLGNVIYWTCSRVHGIRRNISVADVAGKIPTRRSGISRRLTVG